MMSCSRACVLSSPRALALSCSHALMLSGSPTVMPSCSRASKPSYRKESGNALLFCSLASRLVFSDSLPSSLFIPSEKIRSLCKLASRSCSYRFPKSCSRRDETPVFGNKGPLRSLDVRDLSKSSKMTFWEAQFVKFCCI